MEMYWPACYEIRVAEPLACDGQQFFLDFDLQCEQDPSGKGTLLRGSLRDPPALFGLLARIRDLNLTLLEVRRVAQP